MLQHMVSIVNKTYKLRLDLRNGEDTGVFRIFGATIRLSRLKRLIVVERDNAREKREKTPSLIEGNFLSF